MTWNAYDMEFDAYGYDDGPVACDDCGEVYPESALHNGICAGCCFKRPNYWEQSADEGDRDD